jgi:protein SCO1/2
MFFQKIKVRTVRRACLAVLAAATVVALAGCSPKVSFKNTDVTGANFGHDFSLIDHTGTRRTLADYKGKAVAIFFGYTHCPDVCPTTMAEMSAVMKQLGPDAERVQVLFISVDPERDTPAFLSQYVPAFDPRFVGLTGSVDDVAAAAKEFKVFYQKVPGSTDGEYSVDHFAGMYLYDPQGHMRVFVKYGTPADSIAADLKTLLG